MDATCRLPHTSRARQFRKNGLTKRAEAAPIGPLATLRGPLRYMCERQCLVAVHIFTTLLKDCHATCASSGASATSRRLFCYMQTVEPRTHREDRYTTCADGSASRSPQILSTSSSNCLATCADGGASITTLRYMCELALPGMAFNARVVGLLKYWEWRLSRNWRSWNICHA